MDGSALTSMRTAAASALAAIATQDLQSAACVADIISCATLAKTPLIKSEWLKPGTHLDLIGSFTPEMSEAEPPCLQKSCVYIDTPEALHKAGDILNAIKGGLFDPKQQLCGTLRELCQGSVQGRTSDKDITLFKSVGTALEDLAAAELAYTAINPSIKTP